MKLNQLGVSLVQVMFAIAAVSGIGLIVMQSQDNVSKIQQKNNFDFEVETAAKRISIALANPASCAQTISTVTTLNNSLLVYPLQKIFQSVTKNGITISNVELFNTTNIMGAGKLRIKELNLELKPDAINTRMGKLTVLFSNKDPQDQASSSKKISDIKKSFNLIVSNFIGSRPRNCIGDSKNKLGSFARDNCTKLGGESIGGKCILKSLPKCIITKAAQCPAKYYKVEDDFPITLKKVNQYKRQCTTAYYHHLGEWYESFDTYKCTCFGPNCRCNTPALPWGNLAANEGTRCVDDHAIGNSSYIQCCYKQIENGSPVTEEGSSESNGTCFVSTTEISLFNGDKKPISEIFIGDELVDGKGKKVIVQALKRYFHQGPVFSINGGEYFFTANHPFLTIGGWKSLDPKETKRLTPGLKVSQLKIGDILIKKNGVEVLSSLDSLPYHDFVYNFTVSDSHEYIAEDYVVHNEKCRYCNGGTP